MKILIWTLTIFGMVILNTLLGMSSGVQMGSVLLCVVIYFTAKWLCGRWDARESEKTQSVFAASAEAERAEAVPEGWYLCPTCGALIRDGQHCSHCEKKETVQTAPEQEKAPEPKTAPVRYCRKCGVALIPEGKFCPRCGTKTLEE